MSDSVHIFLSTGLTPHDAAGRLAAVLNTVPVERDGDVFVTASVDGAEVGGQVMRNTYGAPPDPEPDEISAIDGYDIAFEIRHVPADEGARRAAARSLFDEIVERLDWPALLVENLGILVTAWRPGVGRTDFPPGITPDADDEEEWRPYAITVS